MPRSILLFIIISTFQTSSYAQISNEWIGTEEENIQRAWSELKEKYGVEKHEDYVLSHDKRKYFKRHISDFAKDLESEQLLYPELAKYIAESFDEVFKDFHNKTLTKAFKNWIKFNWQILGSKKTSSLPVLAKEDFFPKKDEIFTKKVQKFFSRLEFFFKTHDPKYPPKRIMLLSSSGGGGGHYTPASALKDYIAKAYPDITVMLYDSRTYKVETDIFFKLTGALHVEMIYDEFRQKEENAAKFLAYMNVRYELRQYLPEERTKVVMEAISEWKPDILVSFTESFFELSYFFDLPLMIVSTNYALNGPWHKILNHSLIKFAIPVSEPKFFTEMFKDLPKGFISTQQQKTHQDFLSNKTDWKAFQSAFPFLLAFGYPIREGIGRISDRKTLEHIREHLGVRHNAKVIPIMMGKNGVGVLKTIAENIVEHEDSFPLDVDFYFLTGDNAALRSDLEKINDRIRNQKIRIIPLGLLSASEISNLWNISEFLVSKPGGSTTAEVEAVGIPLLSVAALPWELENLQHLERFGLGYDIGTKDISKEMMAYLKMDLRSKIKPHQSLDWKKNFDRMLSSWIHPRF